MNYSVGTALLTVSYDVFSHIGAERRQSLKSLTAETVDEMSTDESCFIDSRTDPRGVTSAHIQFLRVIALSTKKHSTERIRHILPFRLRTVSRTRISGLGSGPVPKSARHRTFHSYPSTLGGGFPASIRTQTQMSKRTGTLGPVTCLVTKDWGRNNNC